MDTDTRSVLRQLREEVEVFSQVGDQVQVAELLRFSFTLDFAAKGQGWEPGELSKETALRMVFWVLDVADVLAAQLQKRHEIDEFYKRYPWSDIDSHSKLIVGQCPTELFVFIPIPMQPAVFTHCWSVIMDFLMRRYYPEED